MEKSELIKILLEYDNSVSILHETLKKNPMSMSDKNDAYDKMIGFKTSILLTLELINDNKERASEIFNKLYQDLLKGVWK